MSINTRRRRHEERPVLLADSYRSVKDKINGVNITRVPYNFYLFVVQEIVLSFFSNLPEYLVEAGCMMREE